MKKLLLFLFAIGVAMGAKGTITASADGKTVTIENFNSSDLTEQHKAELAAAEKAIIKGTISNDGGGFNNNMGNYSFKSLDLSGLNVSSLNEVKGTLAKMCSGAESTLTTPSAMTEIDDEFKDFKAETIIISDGVTTIKKQAFYNNAYIKVVYIPKSIKNVQAAAFYHCEKLTDVIFESGISGVKIGSENDQYNGVFQNCEALKHVTIPEGVTDIGACIFYDCKNLESVHLPSTLKTIGDDAFHLCKEMSQLVIPKNVTTIGKRAFQNSGLKDIYVMQTDVTKLPRIYPDTSTGDNSGTFIATEQLGTNYEQQVVTVVKRCSENYNYNEKLQNYKNSGLTEEQAKEKCRIELKEIILQELTTTATIGTVVLHYPNLPVLKAFYDANPENIDNKTYLSDTYSMVDAAGNTWPTKGDSYYDGYSLYPQNTRFDYQNRIDAGKNPSTGIFDQPSIYGWRQLPIQTGFTESEVITKLVDDTWYTLCPPCDVSDEQLAIAFNEGFNLAEFDAARVMKDVDGEEALVFFFTKVAKADNDYRTNVLARGGHPYMIHQNKGIEPGSSTQRVEAYLAMTLTQPKEGYTYSPEDNKKEIKLTDAREATKVYTGTWTEMVKNDQGGYDRVTRSQVAYDGETDTGHTFTFIGKTDAAAEPIGSGNYFLGCEKDNDYGTAYYPKWYKETSDVIKGNGGAWTQYTAIIKPSSGADAWLKANLNQNSDSKKIDVEIGRNDLMETTTGIEDVLQEAREKNQPIKYLPVVYNINGLVVRTDSINLDGLPTGLYIVNGKKYFVK